MWEQKKQTYWPQIIIFFLLNPNTQSTFSCLEWNLIYSSELREATTSKSYPLLLIHKNFWNKEGFKGFTLMISPLSHQKVKNQTGFFFLYYYNKSPAEFNCDFFSAKKTIKSGLVLPISKLEGVWNCGNQSLQSSHLHDSTKL